MKLPKCCTTVTPFSKALAMILFVSLPFIGFYFGTIYQKQVFQSSIPKDVPKPASFDPTAIPTKIPTSAPTLFPTPEVKIINNNQVQYIHPQLNYSVIYPAGWRGEESFLGKKYEDFNIYSPDYQESENGYGLTQGSMFMISVSGQQGEMGIDEYFDIKPEENSFGITNPKYTQVDSIKAVQYDYSYEGWLATDTKFTKNDLSYLIKFRYPNSVERQKRWPVYQQILRSFKTVAK